MFLHVGNSVSIRNKNIIVIFDMDSATVSKVTRDFLNENQKRGNLETVALDIPKSFVVTQKEKKNRIYLSQISPVTLIERLD